MDTFYSGLDANTATRMSLLSRRAFHLREQSKRLLDQLGCETSAQLLIAITGGQLAEHPAYEAWLAVECMQHQRETARRTLDALCRGGDGQQSADEEDPLLLSMEQWPAAFQHEPPIWHDDGVALQSSDGLHVLARVLSAQAWSIEWRRGETLWRCDTAPVAHAGVDTLAHTHLPTGEIVPAAIGIGTEATTSAHILCAVLQALADGSLPSAPA